MLLANRRLVPLLLASSAAVAVAQPGPPAASPAPNPPTLSPNVPPAAQLPEGFVAVADLVPTLWIDLRYATSDNFIGAPVDGYETGRAILTRPAAFALRAVQAELSGQGLGLKLFDAYRPQRAVQHFIRWVQDPAPAPTRERYFPSLQKADLFAQGYLALESAHSRGSAVDVTLARRRPDGAWEELDLGTPHDFLGPESAPDSPAVTPEQRARRDRLREVMERHGFAPSAREWWHFTLRDEPYPDTYYDFPVR